MATARLIGRAAPLSLRIGWRGRACVRGGKSGPEDGGRRTGVHEQQPARQTRKPFTSTQCEPSTQALLCP